MSNVIQFCKHCIWWKSHGDGTQLICEFNDCASGMQQPRTSTPKKSYSALPDFETFVANMDAASAVLQQQQPPLKKGKNIVSTKRKIIENQHYVPDNSISQTAFDEEIAAKMQYTESTFNDKNHIDFNQLINTDDHKFKMATK